MMYWEFTIGFIVLAVVWTYQKITFGICKSSIKLAGKVAIVTGSNTGIGYEVAKDLAMRKAKVIIACRNVHRGKSAVSNIKLFTNNENVVFKKLDLSSLESIQRFSKEIHKEEQKLDILINNAAVLNMPFERTKDGLEVNMATNHFGPFLLTILLLDLLKKSSKARIINTTSIVHEWMRSFDIENINSESSFNKNGIYSQTKLANILFTRALSEKLKTTNITVNCVHPGTVQTELFRNLPFPFKYFMQFVGAIVFKTTKQGAQTTIFCAVAEEIENISGKYFCDCKIRKPGKLALNDEVAKKLWELSKKYTKCSVQI